MKFLRHCCLAIFVAVVVPMDAGARTPSPAAEPPPSPAVWRVSDADSSVYLFGSMGLSPHGASWRSRAVGRAIDASEILWLEASLDDPAAQAAANEIFNKEGMLPTGAQLSSLLPADAAAAIDATAVAAGFTPAAIEPLKPWSAFVLFSSKIDADATAETVDAAILREARSRGREIRYFETVAESLHRLTGLPQGAQIDILARLIVDFDAQRADARAGFDAWRIGDLAAADAHMNQTLRETSPVAYKTLVTDRVETLAGAIEAVLNAPDTAFISLNASYVVGPGALPETLAARGYKVERINE